MFQAFNLEDQYTLYNQVQAITAIQFDAFIFNGKQYLSLKSDFPEMKLMTKAFFVCRLQKSWAERAMHLNSAANHVLSQTLHEAACSVSLCLRGKS